MWNKHPWFLFLVNSNTYYNTHENSNISVLNRVYNTLHKQLSFTLALINSMLDAIIYFMVEAMYF